MFTASNRILMIAIILVSLCNISTAQMCGKLKAVSCGEVHSLAIADDNSLLSCGSNDNYVLGQGQDISQSLTFKEVKGINGSGNLQNVSCFDAGWEHNVAVANNILVSWGSAPYGQLGNGGYDPCQFPGKVHGLNNVGYLSDHYSIVAVSAGRSGEHSLAVDSNGYIYSFGINYEGQCGIGDTQSPNDVLPYPRQVVGETGIGSLLGGPGNKIVAVEAGANHSLALSDLGQGGYVYEWGGNINSSSDQTIPHKVPNYDGNGYLRNIKGIASCGHSVAVDSNGFVYEWQSWDPADPQSEYNRPHRVPGEDGEGFLSNIKMVSAGSWGTIALANNGQVWMWSYNGYPTRVPCGQMHTQSGWLENIVSIAGGYYDFRIALDDQGRGWAWGTDNSSGKMGTGNTNPYPTPVSVSCPEESGQVFLTKTITIESTGEQCVRPFSGSNYLRFTLSYSNPVTNPSDPNYIGTLYDVNVVDVLPFEVDYYSATNGATYNSTDKTVTLHVGTLSPGGSGSFNIETKVNKHALPGDYFTNLAYLEAQNYWAMAEAIVPVCNWGGTIIYVDKKATTGFNNGTTWDDAFLDLQDGIAAAQRLEGDIAAIWVGSSTTAYKPVWDVNISNYKSQTFTLPDNVAFIGHFGGVGTYETSAGQRNLSDTNKTTILDGQIGDEAYKSVYKVITASNVYNGLVDGFKIKGGSGKGVYLDNSNVSVLNCRFENTDYGVQATNYSYPYIHNCIFSNNSTYSVDSDTSEPDISYCIFDGNGTGFYGLNLTNGSVSNIINSDFKNHSSSAIYGSNATIDINECSISNNGSYGARGYHSYMTVLKTIFKNNTGYGLYLEYYSNLDIENCIIRQSGYQGIYLSQNSSTEIINNWIHNNGTATYSSYGAGIYFENQIGIPIVRNNTICGNFSYGIECSQNGADPNIINCVISGNDTDDLYRENGTFNRVSYCLLQHSHSGAGNITGDPCFMNLLADSNDLHLAENSPCKNAGNPNISYDGETDIDGEPRVAYGQADIGGDEYYWSKADYSQDGIVDFADFVMFVNKWTMQDANISLDADNDVDIYDLELFCGEWLWEAGWMQGLWMMTMGEGYGNMSMAMQSSSLLETNGLQTETGDALMLPDAESSFAAGPARLRARIQKFYDIAPLIASVPATPVTLDSTSMSISTNTSMSVDSETLGLAAVEEPVVSEEQAEPEQINIEELVDWIDQLWQTGELGGSEEEYLDFRNAVQESLADESQ